MTKKNNKKTTKQQKKTAAKKTGTANILSGCKKEPFINHLEKINEKRKNCNKRVSPETISWSQYTQACVFQADSYFFSPPHSTASIFSIWCSFTSNNRQLYVYTFSSTILTWLCCQSRTVRDIYAWWIIEDLVHHANLLQNDSVPIDSKTFVNFNNDQ